MLKEDDPALADIKSVGFILCANSLDESHPYCSRTCCQQSIKNAIALKEKDPKRKVYVWFKEVRTFGLLEEYYTRARELGVIFTRYDNDTLPAGQRQRQRERQGRATRTCAATSTLPLDCLVLATATVGADGASELSKMLKVPLTAGRLLPRGPRQAAPGGLRLRGHLPLRLGPLPQEHRGDHQPGLRRGRSRRRHPRQAGHQGRRRGGRGRPGEVRGLPHLRPHLPLRGADHRSGRARRPRSRRRPARAAACASASAP